MIRKIQTNKDLAFVFIPKAFMELLGLHKGQSVDVRVVHEKILIAPVTEPSTAIVTDASQQSSQGVCQR